MTTIEPVAVGDDITIRQRIDLKPFLLLSLKNGLLNLITLTLYRFWGKTEVRRRVWSGVELNGEPLEYTGRGKELFLGFLIALAVIGLPFLVFVFAAQFLGPLVTALIIPLGYVAMFFLVGFGMFTAFRYMASRTTWRGVRFQLEGSAASYGWHYLGYLLLTGITLGWFWPAAQRRLAEPLWSGLRLGDRRFRFDIAAARKVSIYETFILGIVISAMAYAVFLFAAIGLVEATSAGGERTEPSLVDLGLLSLITLVLLLALGVAFAPFQSAMLRSISAGVKLEGASFKLDVPWAQMAWLSITNIALLIVSLGLLMPFVQARTTRTLVSHLSSTGLADLAAARQAERGPATGEGLADAFGFSAI